MFNNSKFASWLSGVDNRKEIKISSFKLPTLVDFKVYTGDKIVLFFSKEEKFKVLDTPRFKEVFFNKFKLEGAMLNNPEVSCVILRGEDTTYSYDQSKSLFIDHIVFDNEKNCYILKHVALNEKKPMISDLEQWYFLDKNLDIMVYINDESSFTLKKGFKNELILRETDRLTMFEKKLTFSNVDALSKYLKPPIKTMLKMLVKEELLV